jgi:hypothetical protein
LPCPEHRWCRPPGGKLAFTATGGCSCSATSRAFTLLLAPSVSWLLSTFVLMFVGKFPNTCIDYFMLSLVVNSLFFGRYTPYVYANANAKVYAVHISSYFIIFHHISSYFIMCLCIYHAYHDISCMFALHGTYSVHMSGQRPWLLSCSLWAPGRCFA